MRNVWSFVLGSKATLCGAFWCYPEMHSHKSGLESQTKRPRWRMGSRLNGTLTNRHRQWQQTSVTSTRLLAKTTGLAPNMWWYWQACVTEYDHDSGISAAQTWNKHHHANRFGMHLWTGAALQLQTVHIKKRHWCTSERPKPSLNLVQQPFHSGTCNAESPRPSYVPLSRRTPFSGFGHIG